MGGQVDSRDSNAHSFPPIFIFHVVKPWQELGSGGHVQQGRQSGIPGDCWVQQGEGLLNKTLLELTCGLFNAIPGKCRTGDKLFAVPRAMCSGVIPDLKPWGALRAPQLRVVASKSQPFETGLSLQSLEGHQQSCCVPWQPRSWTQSHVKPKNPLTIPVSLHPHTPGLCFLGV